MGTLHQISALDRGVIQEKRRNEHGLIDPLGQWDDGNGVVGHVGAELAI